MGGILYKYFTKRGFGQGILNINFINVEMKDSKLSKIQESVKD